MQFSARKRAESYRRGSMAGLTCLRETSVCTVITVPDPSDVTPDEWRNTMFPAMSSEDYVAGGYAARVYGINQLACCRDIPDGYETGILVSPNCGDAIDTAEATSGKYGTRLMTRLGMDAYIELNSNDDHYGHGHLPRAKGKKHALYCIYIRYHNQVNMVADLIKAGIPHAPSLIRVFTENGGAFLGGIENNDMLSRILDWDVSHQYLVHTLVSSHEEGIKDWMFLKLIREIKTAVAFIEV